MHPRTLLLAAATLSIPAFSQTGRSSAPPPRIAPIPGFDQSVMDTAADPCADFYRYACGKFSQKYPIPGDLPMYDQFENLNEYNRQLLHGILETASTGGANRSPEEQKTGDYYASCMNTSAIDAAGLKPLQPELDRIAAIKDKSQLPALLAHYQKIGINAFFSFGSMQDFHDATREIAVADQDGLGLPEKDYYLRTDAKSLALRQQYAAHIAKMLEFSGTSKAQSQADAQAVLALETSMAKVSMGMVDRRDPYKNYHMEPVATLVHTDPTLDWASLIRETGAPPITELNVANPAYFAALNGILQQASLPTLRAYLRVHLLDSFASRLPTPIDQENFDFYDRKLFGVHEMPVRWKRCVSATDAALGEALGKVYVSKYFAGDSKQQTLAMVQAIEQAMHQDLTTLSWMSPETRVKAEQKLDLITNKIGYPNKWRDYSTLTIRPDDALGNSMRAREFEAHRQLAKINKPVDKQEWDMSPPTVNAYYDPSMNNINFPAGILQPAFYDPSAPRPANYGHIGAIVGHELTHGFDDQGSQFDGNGNLKNWWTAEDKKQFDARTECVANEYSGFTAIDDLHVNGKESLGENTADNGGLRLAYIAMEAWAGQHHVDLSKRMGLYTPEQQFFIGFAQNWCSNNSPEFLRVLVQSDPHSPDQFRANGVLRNMPEFSTAFGCKKGQPMAPINRCRVW